MRALVAAVLGSALVACAARDGAPAPKDPLLARYDEEMAEALALRAALPDGAPLGSSVPQATVARGSVRTLETTMTGQGTTLTYTLEKAVPPPLTVPIPQYQPSTPPYRPRFGK